MRSGSFVVARRVVVVVAVGVAVAPGCALFPPTPANVSDCARARLAREWNEATTEPFRGCWASASWPGVIELTDRPSDVGDFADEPPTFAIAGAEIVHQPTRRVWELLGHGLARLSWTRGFQGVTACVAAEGSDRLVGEVRVFTQASPLPSAPTPLVLTRVPCPGS
jgi:hypothetical protein